MRRVVTTLAIVACCLATLRADVTLTQTMTIEGGMAAMMGGMQPKMTMRIKGNKARADVDVMDQKITTITDLTSKEVTVLNAATRTAMVMNPMSMATPQGAPGPMPDIDLKFKATGQTRTIENVPCEDHVFTLTLNMAEAGGAQMPPDAAAAMKDVKMVMNGTSCIAKGGPGAAEYMAFQKAAADQALGWVLSGMTAPGQQSQGLEKLMSAASSAPGVPYLTEILMSFEGSGPMVDMMKQMGAMKMVQKVTSVSTDAIADDIFTIPADYKVEKKE